ncbi:LacI family DNA-binding transcriptional regulator [Deinococcus oregonensis]|uniref:LacI family DNA-binding transcriptional regulator n=1 Tax=Deinococcus oregonensis TaxID=1805970 RepID=A0ABV6AV71_9DEIO
MTTLKDVAARAGVSIATASYVLNGTKPTGAEVTRRVKQAARDLGYRPNRAARALKTGSSLVIGLTVPDLQNPFFPKMVQAAERRARELGYGLALVDVAEDPRIEREALEQFAEQGVAAVIATSLLSPLPGSLPYPVIALDTPIVGVDSIYADHRTGGSLAAQQAVALGHTRIGLLSGPQHIQSARLRRQGTLEGLGGLAEVVWESEVPFNLELPSSAIALLEARQVSMIITGSDVIAVGALHALQEAGVNVPGDVSLIGFDDIAWASLMRPRLSTIRQPIVEMGTRAVDLALRRLKGPDSAITHEMLSVEWIPRESSAQVR